MKKDLKTPLTEAYLKSLEGMKPAEPKDFFYARLKERMGTEDVESGWVFQFKPSLLIAALTVLLVLNIILLFKHGKAEAGTPSSIRAFATAYDQNLSGIY